MAESVPTTASTTTNTVNDVISSTSTVNPAVSATVTPCILDVSKNFTPAGPFVQVHVGDIHRHIDGPAKIDGTTDCGASSYMINVAKWLIPVNTTVVDAHAGTGLWVTAVAQDNITTMAFEADTSSFHQLCAHVCLNRLSAHVHCHQVSLTDTSSTSTPPTPLTDTSSTSTPPTPLTSTSTSTSSSASTLTPTSTPSTPPTSSTIPAVTYRTLDSYNLTNVSVLKLTVTDTIEAFINGCVHTLAGCRPILLFQSSTGVNGANNDTTITTFLSNQNYVVRRVVAGEWLAVHKEDARCSQLLNQAFMLPQELLDMAVVLRSSRRNQDCFELLSSHKPALLTPAQEIVFEDELLIAAWYCGRKDVAAQAADRIKRLWYEGSRLSPQTLSNIGFLTATSWSLDLKTIPLYVINLATDERRRQHIRRQFGRIGLEPIFVEAVRREPHYLGCSESYLKVLRLALARGQKAGPFAIFEDDVAIPEYITSSVVDVPVSADAVYLGISKWGTTSYYWGCHIAQHVAKITKVNDTMSKISGMLTGHGILYVSQEYVQRTLRNIEASLELEMVTDIGLSRIQHGYNIYAYNQPFVYQDGSVGGQEEPTRFTLAPS